MAEVQRLSTTARLVSAARIHRYPAVTGQVDLDPAVEDVVQRRVVAAHHHAAHVPRRQSRCPGHGDVDEAVLRARTAATRQYRRCYVPATGKLVVHLAHQVTVDFPCDPVGIFLVAHGLAHRFLDDRVFQHVLAAVLREPGSNVLGNVGERAHLLGTNVVGDLVDGGFHLHLRGDHALRRDVGVREMGKPLSPLVRHEIRRLRGETKFPFEFLAVPVLWQGEVDVEPRDLARTLVADLVRQRDRGVTGVGAGEHLAVVDFEFVEFVRLVVGVPEVLTVESEPGGVGTR